MADDSPVLVHGGEASSDYIFRAAWSISDCCSLIEIEYRYIGSASYITVAQMIHDGS